MAQPNFASGTIWTGDNLEVMRGINSACVDLIYLDPPFNSNRTYSAPIGSEAAGASFKDAWTLDDADEFEHGELAERNPAAGTVIEAARLAHGKSMMAYLIFMAVRLLEMRRVLKPTGSIYLHCDPAANSYLRLLLDAVFGSDHQRNEILWCYTSPGAPRQRQFSRRHDTIYWYSKERREWVFNADAVRVPHSEKTQANFKSGLVGSGFGPGGYELPQQGKIPETWWTKFSQVRRIPKERVGYPTQKPLALLDRIIRASSNPGDLVLDPFCGCATTLVAADRLGRDWAGIDLSPLAIKLVNDRITADRGKGGTAPLWGGATALDQPPKRTDLGPIPPYRTNAQFLYGKQIGNCAGCGVHFPFSGLTVDHILPRSRGGTDHLDNLQLLCLGCNSSKGNRTMPEWRAAQLRGGKARH